MGEIDTGISDYSQGINFTGVGEVYQPGAVQGGSKPDSGASSIQKSEEAAMAMYLAPAMNFPVLVMPSSDSDAALAGVTSLLSKGGANVELFLQSAQLKMDSITSEMLDNWGKSIQQMNQDIKDILSSPAHRQVEEAKAREILAQQTKPQDNMSIVTFFDHAIKLERVDGASKVTETSRAAQAAKEVAVHVLSAAMIGGALAIGSFEMSIAANGVTSTPLVNSVELVERLQPLFPNLLQNVLPTINLMVMPLIYFTSWDSTIGNAKNKEKASDLTMAQNFAKEVIQTVSNSAFFKINFVEQMLANKDATGSYKDQQVALLKLILACTALSLLYSVDVGKVIGNKFLGMEPQEFQGLLSGSIPITSPSQDNQKLTDSQRYQSTLIKLIKAQLDVLPPEEKVKVLNTLFEYFSAQRSMTSMLDPARVLGDVLDAGAFDPVAKQLGNHAV